MKSQTLIQCHERDCSAIRGVTQGSSSSWEYATNSVHVCRCCNRGIDTPQHKCCCNWSGSSAAMETDITAEGFSLSEQMYSLRYMSVIDDGDSSVIATIQQAVLYGIFVKKIECTNHDCKAYRSRLEALAKDNPQYHGKGGLTKKAIQRLTVGARIAIVKHSITYTIVQLQHDLRNGPSHVFGNHTRYSREFCTFLQSESTPDDEDQAIPPAGDITQKM